MKPFQLRYGLVAFIALWSVWELLAHFSLYKVTLVPPPSQFAPAILEMARKGYLWDDFKSSMFRYISGLSLGIVFGIFLGLMTGSVQVLRDTINPLMNYFRSIPSIALVPAAIVWFGIGETEKVFIVTWGCLFPVWLNTFSGVVSVEREYIWAARSLGASKLTVFLTVSIPASASYIVAGMRVSVATGFFALASAEMAGTYKGLAFRIFQSHEFFRTDMMIASILIIGLVAWMFDQLFVVLSHRLLPWLHRGG